MSLRGALLWTRCHPPFPCGAFRESPAGCRDEGWRPRSTEAPDPLCSTPPAVLQGRRHGPRNRGLPGWDGGESPAERPLAPRGPTDTGQRTPAPGVRTELLPGEEVGALEGFPHSRLQSLGPSERLAGPSIPRLVGGAEPLQALAPANPRTRPHPARKEPPAHCRAWAGTGEADAPHQSGHRGSRCRWARSRERKGRRCPPHPGQGAFGLAEGSTEGHGGDLDLEGGRPSPDCWQIVTYTQSGKQNLTSP